MKVVNVFRLAVILSAFIFSAYNVPAAAVYVPPVDLIESIGYLDGQEVLTYSVTNGLSDTIFSVLIGIPSGKQGMPAEPAKNTPAWTAFLLDIWHDQNTGASSARFSDCLVFDNLPFSFDSYSMAYLFYDESGTNGIAPDTTGTFLVYNQQVASPFVYTVTAVDPVNPPASGYSFDGSGDSTNAVPVPAALLLFGSGLTGLAAFRKRLTR